MIVYSALIKEVGRNFGTCVGIRLLLRWGHFQMMKFLHYTSPGLIHDVVLPPECVDDVAFAAESTMSIPSAVIGMRAFADNGIFSNMTPFTIVM